MSFPTPPKAFHLLRLTGMALVLALVAGACGMHQEEATTYGENVATPPKFIRGTGGGRLGEPSSDKPAARASKREQQVIPVVTAPLPKPPRELGFVWPVGGRTTITSPYGWRIDPIRKSKSFHHGMDIGCWRGQSIVAANDGQVLWAGKARVYGKAVLISHGYGLMTVYGHMRDLNVTIGQRIGGGESIGTCGSTGRSTGTHLHLEMRYGNQVYDPLEFLP